MVFFSSHSPFFPHVPNQLLSDTSIVIIVDFCITSLLPSRWWPASPPLWVVLQCGQCGQVLSECVVPGGRWSLLRTPKFWRLWADPVVTDGAVSCLVVERKRDRDSEDRILE